MNTARRRQVLSMSAVAAGSLVIGLVLAGGLSLTPATVASSSAAAPPAVPAAQPPLPSPASYPDFSALADRVTPAVVSVITEDVAKPSDGRRFHQDMDPFEFFFGPGTPHPDMRTPRKRTGAGSGFFVGSDGLIVTNNHVVEGAEKIQVRLTDETEMSATIVGRDPATDVALIKVDGKGPFATLPLGDSDTLKVGEWVMAVGNPLAMAHTVTVGVVSAKGRQIGISPDPNVSSFEDYIQTDAAINLGNSGGPLVNVRGEVVGMNSAINAAGQNIGFAIPVNTIRMVIPQLKEKGKVVRGYLGVSILPVDQKAQEFYKLASRDGAVVQSVNKGGPADKAGLKEGDVIVGVAGKPVRSTRDLIFRVSAMAPSQKADLDVIREGKRQGITVTLGERPATEGDDQAAAAKEDTPTSKLGIQVDDLNQRTRRQFEIPREIDGVVVTDITDLSPADDANLRPGDVIMRVNDHEIGSAQSFRETIGGIKSGTMVRFYIYRPQAEQTTFLVLRMP